MRELAIKAEQLLQELDKIEAAERNLNIKPEVYVVGVNGQRFEFNNQDDMFRFINSIGRRE